MEGRNKHASHSAADNTPSNQSVALFPPRAMQLTLPGQKVPRLTQEREAEKAYMLDFWLEKTPLPSAADARKPRKLGVTTTSGLA